MSPCDAAPGAGPCTLCLGAEPGTALAVFHDRSWGVPRRNPTAMFDAMALAMVMWRRSPEQVLARWPDMRRVFDGFVPQRMAGWGGRDIDRVLADPDGLAERCTVTDLVINARVWCGYGGAGGAAVHLWQSVGGQPVLGNWLSRSERPTITPLSRRLCDDLTAAGFRGMTPGKVLNFMQNAGLVNDHLRGCPQHGRHQTEASNRASGLVRP